MQPRAPTVTVVIPTFNRARYIGAALASVLAQSRSVDEIIVVDDGSTDNTHEVVASFKAEIRYIRQDNSGPSAARNRGVRETRCDYIAFLDSDDLWTPQKIEWQLALFKQNPKIEFIFGDMANFTGTVTTTAPEIKNRELHDYLVTHAEHLEDLFAWLIIENIVPTPTVICKRSAVEKVGLFDEKLRIAEDLDYWLRAAEVCHWGFINAVLLLRRRHESNLVSDFTQRNLGLLSVLGETAKRPTTQSTRLQRLIAEKCSDIHYDLGSAFLRSRNYRDARFHLSQVRTTGTRKAIASLKHGTAMLLNALGVGSLSR